MKKQILLAFMCLAPLAFCPAKEIGTKQGASMEITTRTTYGVNIDDPFQHGLQMDFAQLGIFYNLLPGELVTNRIKSDDPFGFIQLELGGLQIRFTSANNLSPDNNNPNKGTNVGLGWNANNTGYFSPVYIERFLSGISFGDLTLQLAAGGDPPENWRPWSRNNGSYATSQIINRWAYLDTRLQYRRETIPNYLSKILANGLPAETVYWKDGEAYNDLALAPAGTMIGLQLAQPDFSVMAKFATERTFSQAATETDAMNGIALGLDLAIAPVAAKGLRVFLSSTKEFEYGPDGSSQPFAIGGKAGFDIPLGESISIEPYAGYQAVLYDVLNELKTDGQEFSGGITLHWPGAGGWQFDNLQQRNGVLFPGLTAAWTAVDKDINSGDDALLHNVRLTLFEESGDYGLLPAFGTEISVQWEDIANPDRLDKILATAYFDLSINDVFGGILIPWTRVFWDNLGGSTGRIDNFKVDAGVKLTKAIKNTTIGITWESKNLTAASGDIENLDLTNGYFGFGFLKVWAEVKL